MTEDIVYRLRKRAEIRRQIKDRRSVREGQPDRLAELLEEAAAEIESLRTDAQQSSWDKQFTIGEQCPKCGLTALQELSSGVKCSRCDYWFCY